MGPPKFRDELEGGPPAPEGEAMKRVWTVLGVLAIGLILLAACGDGDDPTPTPTPPGTLEISVTGDTLRFDKDRLEAAVGAEVEVTFRNVSSFNQHNFVVVRAGTKDAVAADGLVVGLDDDYVEPGDERVIANTPVVSPGGTEVLRFSAPAAGNYQFVCTVPGHNVTMFGDFVVTP